MPLAPLTTFGIGGPARYFIEAHDEETVVEALLFVRLRRVPLFVLGGGSNILVADEGFPGVVLHMRLRGLSERAANGKVVLTAAAGEDWDAFVRCAVERGLGGVECLSGIPGTVGGTPIQNVGAYGQEAGDVITRVRAWDRSACAVAELSQAECGFSYRQSIFNTVARDRYVVLSVTFALPCDARPSVKYADLQKYFAGRAGTPTLREVREAVRQIRASKAMLLVPGDPDCRSAGSFFKNPIVSEEQYQAIAARTATPAPRYPVAGQPGRVKMAAAWLIEQSGFSKGYGHGPVGLSTRHTLALVNRGGASARDVLALMREIQKGVRERFGIELSAEPLLIGFPQ